MELILAYDYLNIIYYGLHTASSYFYWKDKKNIIMMRSIKIFIFYSFQNDSQADNPPLYQILHTDKFPVMKSSVPLFFFVECDEPFMNKFYLPKW